MGSQRDCSYNYGAYALIKSPWNRPSQESIDAYWAEIELDRQESIEISIQCGLRISENIHQSKPLTDDQSLILSDLNKELRIKSAHFYRRRKLREG